MHAGVIEKDGGEFKMKLVDAVKGGANAPLL
jgi:hypothetical protein